MTQIEQIKQHIHDLESRLIKGACSAQITMESACKAEAYNEVLSFIESLEKEQKPKGYDESYLQEKIDLATKNGSWRENPEKEQDVEKDLQWAAMEYVSNTAREATSARGWETDDIVNAYKAGYKFRFK